MKKNIRHFFLLTACAAACMHGINRFIDASANMKNLLKTHTGHFFEWRYGNIFYTKSGEGSPLLLIHDLNPVSSSFEWNRVIRKLSKSHTVYAIDLLGCGRSDKPQLTYTNYMYVQLITDFVKKIIEQKSDVIATGTSGSFTLMAANMDDSIFDKIFLVSPASLESYLANPTSKNNMTKKLLELPVIGTFFYHILVRENRITDLFEQEYFNRKSLISVTAKDTYYESAHSKNSSGRFLYGSILGNYTNINIIPALKKIENPIFIIGSRENQKDIRIIDSYVKYDPLIEPAYLSHCSKLPQMEDPDKFCDIIRMFYHSAE